MNDELVAAMRSTFGEDLAFETRAIKNVVTEAKAVEELASAPLEMRSKQTLSGAVPKDYLVNALKAEFEPRDYTFGKSTFKLDWAGMKHILERHHPKLWDGSVKTKQSYFDAKTKIEDLQSAVTDILKQNRATLIERGTNSRFQIEGEYNGVRYTLGIEKGRIRQLYAPQE